MGNIPHGRDDPLIFFPDNSMDAGVRNRKPGRSILGHAKTVFENDPDETSVSDNADFLTFMLLRNLFQKSQSPDQMIKGAFSTFDAVTCSSLPEGFVCFRMLFLDLQNIQSFENPEVFFT